MSVEQKNKNIFDEKFNKYMNKLYDAYVFENVDSLLKKRADLLNSTVNSKNKEKEIKTITKKLQKIYNLYKKEINFLTNQFSKKLLDKQDYELLTRLKAEFNF